MTKPKVFKIDFHNNLSTYFGGQTMTGAVHIESDEDITNINGKILFILMIFVVFTCMDFWLQ
jgi:hypothetical protein